MKKNKTLIIYLSVILFAPLSLTQNEEYDESFLESLPEEVREDLLERKKSREDSEEPQYRRPSSFINKPEDIASKLNLNLNDRPQNLDVGIYYKICMEYERLVN